MKIAVLLNGSGKHLDITSHLFGYWNELYENVTFDFYLATWVDDVDYSQYSWIKSYVRLKEESCPYDLSEHPEGMHQPHYSYTLYKANQLRKESGIKYDGVLQTRTDTYIFRELLDLLTSLYTVKQGINQDVSNSQVSSRIMYSGFGNELLNGRFWTSDYFFFGHPDAFDKFSNMFIDVWIKNELPDNTKLMHIMQAEYLHHVGIYNSSISNYPNHALQNVLIREPHRFGHHSTHTDAGWDRMHPSPFQLKTLIAQNGPKHLLTKDIAPKVIIYFESTDKENKYKVL